MVDFSECVEVNCPHCSAVNRVAACCNLVACKECHKLFSVTPKGSQMEEIASVPADPRRIGPVGNRMVSPA